MIRSHLRRLKNSIGRAQNNNGQTSPINLDALSDAQIAQIEQALIQRWFGNNPDAGRFLDRQDHPIGGPIARLLRESTHALWNTKVLGSEVARMLYRSNVAGPNIRPATDPMFIGLQSKLCTQEDIEHPWLQHWCGQLHMHPMYHRKVWEDCYVLQALWEHGMLREGKRGLGFAVGTEILVSFFASRGIHVLATDIDASDERAAGWRGSNQHAASRDALYKPWLVERQQFDRLCRYQPLDMNHIPRNLHRSFDFCWSVCSLEHVGSIEQGLQFALNSVECLVPGGIAVHTTEFNLHETGGTIDHWPTVLFQRSHIEALRERLAPRGHRMAELCLDPGKGVLDRFVDVPPFEHQLRSSLHYEAAPHIKLSVDGFPVTSIGLIIQAGGA